MKFSTFIYGFLALALVTTSTFFTAPSAEAACSYNGYLNSRGNCAKSYDKNWQPVYYNNYSSSYNDYYRASLERLIEDLLETLRRLQADRDYSYDYNNRYDSEVYVTTLSATNIDDEEATLRGRLYLNDADEAQVYFEYGTSRSDLDEDTSKITLEDGDNMAFKRTIDDLEDDEVYYYRAVAIDEEGDKSYGKIFSFDTDDRSSSNDDDEEPEVETGTVRDITEDSARIYGEVNMNDFNDGRVFFLYGEDEGDIEDVKDDYETYSDIDEDGDDLQKVLLDANLDDNRSYYYDIINLDDDTEIFYTICVEFENEDDDDEIICDSTKSFTTDED